MARGSAVRAATGHQAREAVELHTEPTAPALAAVLATVPHLRAKRGNFHQSTDVRSCRVVPGVSHVQKVFQITLLVNLIPYSVNGRIHEIYPWEHRVPGPVFLFWTIKTQRSSAKKWSELTRPSPPGVQGNPALHLDWSA